MVTGVCEGGPARVWTVNACVWFAPRAPRNPFMPACLPAPLPPLPPFHVLQEYIARFGHGSAKLARQAQSKEKTLAKMVRGGLTEKVCVGGGLHSGLVKEVVDGRGGGRKGGGFGHQHNLNRTKCTGGRGVIATIAMREGHWAPRALFMWIDAGLHVSAPPPPPPSVQVEGERVVRIRFENVGKLPPPVLQVSGAPPRCGTHTRSSVLRVLRPAHLQCAGRSTVATACHPTMLPLLLPRAYLPHCCCCYCRCCCRLCHCPVPAACYCLTAATAAATATAAMPQFVDVAFGYSPDKVLYTHVDLGVDLDSRWGWEGGGEGGVHGGEGRVGRGR